MFIHLRFTAGTGEKGTRIHAHLTVDFSEDRGVRALKEHTSLFLWETKAVFA